MLLSVCKKLWTMLILKVTTERLTLAVSCMHLSKLSNLLSFDDAMAVSDPNINTHLEDLERNLAGFRLEIESISKDGDCAFRSIMRQTLKLD